MKCVKPTKANRVFRLRRRNVPGLIRSSEHQAERGCQGTELRRWHEGEIHLQRAWKEKHAVNPSAGQDVKMIQGEVLMVHVRRPIGEGVRHFGSIAHAKGEIDVRPLVLAA